MTRTFDVSGQLADDQVAALRAITEHFRALGAEMIVIGALARDLVAYLPRQESAPRATKDIDIALRTSTLDEYRELTRGLEKLSSADHKFRIAGYEVDIVPSVASSSRVRSDSRMRYSMSGGSMRQRPTATGSSLL